MNKVACIDIGTNSVRMIILEENNKECISFEKYMDTTRIGSGVDKNRMLSEEAMERTLNALIKFSEQAKKEHVKHIEAIATSAVRDAKNRDVFLERVRENTGMSVEMISGKEEARLGFLGVSKGVESEDDILVIDIGGGSTELIVGKNGVIDYSISLDIGAVRLCDKFVQSEPWEQSDQKAMTEYVLAIINEPIKEILKRNIKKIVGIGGTISTAGSIALQMEYYNRKQIHNYFVSLEHIHEMNKKLLAQTLEERIKTKGLQPKRADIIPAGFIILQELLIALKSDGITISEYDNLEGMFFDKMYKEGC